MQRVIGAMVFALSCLLSGLALAQEAWVQIEAQPSLSEGEARARAYAGAFPNVSGFAMTTGWYAVALGPFAPDEAERQLQSLRSERLIPSDSYIADGSRYRQRFWPVGAAVATPAQTPVEPTVPAVTPAEPAAPASTVETLAESRAAEAALDLEARMELQRALGWDGFYQGGIDGAFGPGTRRSMAAWQAAMGHEETGVLTTAQREALVGHVRAEQAAMGLAAVAEDEAGIEITLPLALVSFDRYEPPFVHYAEKDGSGFRVLLISQQGDADRLAGLYDILQTLSILPLDGERSLGKSGFVINGRGEALHSYAQADLKGGLIKGFILAWRPQDDARAGRVLDAMKASFRPLGDRALDEGLGQPLTVDRAGLMSGLEVRRPVLSRSGFYIAADGTVLTTREVLQSCSRLTLDGQYDAEVALEDAALGLAVLKPRVPLAPPAFARLRPDAPRANSEIALAGYSYEDALDTPVVTFGALAEARGLNGEDWLGRLSLKALPGDAGGPILDSSGSVTGMLLPRGRDPARILPEDVGLALSSMRIAQRLTEAGIPVSESARDGAMAAEDLATVARGMTVLVSCWN